MQVNTYGEWKKYLVSYEIHQIIIKKLLAYRWYLG